MASASTWQRLVALVSVLALALGAFGCGQSEEEKRREAFEDSLRTALTAQQVSPELTDCMVDLTRKTITDDMVALVPPDAGAAELATAIQPQVAALAATCPTALQALGG